MAGPSGTVRRSGSGVLGNTVAMGLAGGSGVVVLLAIASLYGAAALGRFNLLFTVYLVASQIATLALHVATVRYVAPAIADPERRAVALQGSLVAVLVAGGLTAVGLLLASDLLASLLGRPELGAVLRLLAPGVLVFAVTKVLLAALTALGRMRAHAVLVGTRGVGLVVLLGAFRLLGLPAEQLILLVPLTEVILLVPLVVLLRRDLRPSRWTARAVRHAGEHLRFGVLGVGSNLLTEINIRIDIVVLALFVDDRLIGVYTLAAVLAEAVLQLPTVHRTVLGPTVVRLIAERRLDELQRLVVRTRLRVVTLTALAAAAVVIALPFIVAALRLDGDFSDARLALVVLCIGVVVASAYVPFALTLAHAGRPLAQSGFVLAVATINLLGNLLLVPRLGILGAATATAVANVLSVPMLRAAARRVGLRL